VATLTDAISATAAEVAITTPGSPRFGALYQIDDELVRLTRYCEADEADATCWRVDRGVNGTAPATHAQGATLTEFDVTAGGGGGGLPTGWTQVDETTVEAGGGALRTIVLQRPDGTSAVSVSANGILAFYFADGQTLAFDVGAVEDSTVWALRDEDGEPIFSLMPAYAGGHALVFNGERIVYSGNEAMYFDGGGIDMGEYDIENFAQLIPHIKPEIPATPNAQDVVNALLALGLVTQAA
jgi:hypothetical protein